MPDKRPVLIAHRGFPSRYPENTLPGIRVAMEAGACFLECDIQLSSDGIPVLMHDEDLARTAGIDISVYDTSFQDLQKYSVGMPGRFGARYINTRIPALVDLVNLLQDWPGVQVFIELKRGSLARFGRKRVLDAVAKAIDPIKDRCVLISFDSRVIMQAQQRNLCRVGWAVRSMNKRNHERALRLAPDFIFFSINLLPPVHRPLWTGRWQWVIYVINNPEQAMQLARRGILLIETDAIGDMLDHAILKSGKCRNV